MNTQQEIVIFELADLEPIPTYRFDSAKGYYNQMYLSVDQTRFIKLTKLDFEKSLAKKLLRELVYYHKFLMDIGVSVPLNYYIGIQNDSHILEVDEYIPLTFKEFVETHSVEEALKSLLDDIFVPLLTSTDTQYLECGIDTPLRNFQFRDGKAYYIDFFLPRVFFGPEDTILELPDLTDPKDRATGIFNKFNRKGVYYSLFINLCREFPEKRDAFKEICIRKMQDIGQPELAEYIQNPLIEEIFLQSQITRQKFIQDLSFEDIEYFVARDFACYLAIKNKKFADILEDFFRETSNAAGNSFYSNERIKNAKSILLEHI